MYRILAVAALLLSACTPPNQIYGSIDINRETPLLGQLQAQRAAGKYSNVIYLDSGGGWTQGWRNVAAEIQTGSVGMVILRNECNSACLMAAVACANRGVLVKVMPGTWLYWHGEVVISGSIELDYALWMIAGLPGWAVDVERTLAGGKIRQMTADEFARAGFESYDK